jgi:hypothetical protein
MNKLAIGVSLLIAAVASMSTSFAQYPAGTEMWGQDEWGQDECLHVWDGSQWATSDVCRVMRSETMYELYNRGDPPHSLDIGLDEVSIPGWIIMQGLVTPGTFLVAHRGSIFHNLDGGLASIYVLADGNWQNVAALQAAAAGGPTGPDALWHGHLKWGPPNRT